MELWIRSQDKTRLVKADHICYVENIFTNNAKDKYYICSGGAFDLGIYNSKERALEVLDEIQRLITDLQYMSYAVDSSSFYSYRPNVYEMPID